ncbi:MAG: hypothetical protein K9M44_00195 [Candidatus Pacebacteria bacterium]|nr:hypothetical protein [Candidatus Paceibacterota bacterium]
MPFEIEIENLKEIRELFQAYPTIVNQEISKGLLQAGKMIVGTEKREVPIGVTNHLRQSIGMRLNANSVVIVPKKEYAIPVHEGTRPHYVPVHNKRAPLRIWAIKKGLNPYAVQKSIMRKGTKANPFVDRTVDMTNTKVRKIFVQVLEKIIKRI